MRFMCKFRDVYVVCVRVCVLCVFVCLTLCVFLGVYVLRVSGWFTHSGGFMCLCVCVSCVRMLMHAYACVYVCVLGV